MAFPTAVNSQITLYEVCAEYLVEEGSLVLLKDEHHAVVFAVAAHYLLSVVRHERDCDDDDRRDVRVVVDRDEYDRDRDRR